MLSAPVTVEVDYAPLTVVLNAVKGSVSPIMLRTWMAGRLHQAFQEQIINLFAYEGRGFPGWAPLSEATLDLRRRMGNPGTEINEETGEMLNFLITNKSVNQVGGWSQLSIPGSTGDAVMQHKLMTAQMGKKNAPMFNNSEGVDTPARPVLVLEQADRAMVMRMLQEHIVSHVGGGLKFTNIGSL